MDRNYKSGSYGKIGPGDSEALDSEDGAGSDGSWYSGTETGEYQVVE